MTLSPLLADVFVPAVVLLEYGLVKMQSTPLREALWGGFLSGVVVAVVLWFGEPLLLRTVPSLAAAAGGTGQSPLLAHAALEEGSALLLLLWLLRGVVKFADSRDAVLGSLGWSIGFAAMKVLLILLPSFVGTAASGGGALPLRALPVMFEHGVCGLIMGVLLGRACRSITISLWWLFLAFAIPVGIQALLDGMIAASIIHRNLVVAAALLPAAFALATLLAISLCKPPPPRQVVTRGRRAVSPPRTARLSGALMLILGATFVAATALHWPGIVKQALLLRSIVPLLFGIDLLVSGFRQRPRRTA
ncbi:MAG TPA: hypothetical protein VIG49_10765 [Acetobacteraceae bacterium]